MYCHALIFALNSQQIIEISKMNINQTLSPREPQQNKYQTAISNHAKQFIIHKNLRSYKKLNSIQLPSKIIIKKEPSLKLPEMANYQAKKYSIQKFRSLQQKTKIQALRKHASLKHIRKEELGNKFNKVKIEEIKSQEQILLSRLQKYSHQYPQSSNSIALKKGFKKNPFKEITQKKKLNQLKISKGDTSFDGNFDKNQPQIQNIPSSIRIRSQNMLENGLLRVNSTKRLKFVINPLQKYIKQKTQQLKQLKSHLIQQKQAQYFNESDIFKINEEHHNHTNQQNQLEQLLSYQIFNNKS